MKTQNHKLDLSCIIISVRLFFLCALAFLVPGCSEQTYKEDRLVEDLKQICRNEYKIDNIQVKAIGSTIAVFLPLKNLFSANIRDLAALSRVQNLESVLQPSQEALDKVEDVLFSTSRVVLSSDKKIDFYILQATDIEATGLQLVLTGYVDDIKRVRLWDIPRSEYRKRVMHDLRLNRTVVFAKPIYQLFNQLNSVPASELIHNLFVPRIDQESLSPIFQSVMEEAAQKLDLNHEFLDIRSQVVENGEALIYVKLKETYSKAADDTRTFMYPSGSELEYVFVIRSLLPDHYVISKVIPFFYLDEQGQIQKMPFPEELKMDESLEEWQPIFDVEEVKLGDFLAKQIGRRGESFLAADERIFNTFDNAKIGIDYQVTEAAAPYFLLSLDLKPKGTVSTSSYVEDWMSHEDTVYLMNAVLKEFVSVLKSYKFENFSHFEIVNSQLTNPSLVLDKPILELFRKGKIDIHNLLKPNPVSL